MLNRLSRAELSTKNLTEFITSIRMRQTRLRSSQSASFLTACTNNWFTPRPRRSRLAHREAVDRGRVDRRRYESMPRLGEE